MFVQRIVSEVVNCVVGSQGNILHLGGPVSLGIDFHFLTRKPLTNAEEVIPGVYYTDNYTAISYYKHLSSLISISLSLSYSLYILMLTIFLLCDVKRGIVLG
jgi:hypothetical protein